MRNAFNGYTYQKHVTFLLLAMMDTQREISKIEIEAKITDNFDDLVITTNEGIYKFQIKNFKDVSVGDLEIKDNVVLIKGKPHKLSSEHNIIFFKHISIKPKEEVLGFCCHKFSENISLVSLSRTQIDAKLENLYRNNLRRKNEIDSFFNSILDKRIWEISRETLPMLKVFITELQEKSVLITRELLGFKKLLLIEGKPGVGKSHFVNTLIKEFENNILFRFWIGNQDKDYKERLKFDNFIRDLNTKLFYDQKIRTLEELLDKLKEKDITFIIDGLDHVENYNHSDFDYFVNFINKAKNYCKIIVLSRPLIKRLNWKIHTLEDWNFKQTEKVIKDLFHISEYSIVQEVYRISKGYPIIVKYLAEHYKLHKRIPKINEVEDINSYYQSVILNEKGKQSLSLFLCSNSYIMKSEIELFIGHEKYYVEEFIKEHPYLFDIRLNRISLFHDSFNTFLKKQIDYEHKLDKVNRIVSQSILNFEKRFLARFGLFQLTSEQNRSILIKYASIDIFTETIKNEIDYESIITFYNQLRETLKEFSASQLSVNHYYDLSLIFNLISREHLSTINTFYYTYVQSLITNGIADEDITSSGYLFAMYYYVKTKNATLLYNKTSNDHYHTEYFYEELESDIYEEENYVKKHLKGLSKEDIDEEMRDEINLRENLIYVIENIYIHNIDIKEYEKLKFSIEEYVNGDKDEAAYLLRKFIANYDKPEYYPYWILEGAYTNLLSYGYPLNEGRNEYRDLTLNELISKNANLGSFNLREKIHNHFRLAYLENRKTDIHNIYPFWTKYYQRKDYTFYSLPIALRTLHEIKIISLNESVKFIQKIQKSDISEKGYRHLLAEFIEFYSPDEIILFLEDNFDVKELRVGWFSLPAGYISELSEQAYKYEESKIIKEHRNRIIPLNKIKNVLLSNKLDKLVSTLSLLKIKISFNEKETGIVQKFKDSELIFQELEEDNKYDNYKQSSQQRFEKGILTSRDIDFIKSEKLEPNEIAKYSDGYYSSSLEFELFEIFEASEIRDNFQTILYNTLTSKTKSINYFHSLYSHPGNVLAMIEKYRNKKEFDAVIESFENFISLSMFELKLKE